MYSIEDLKNNEGPIVYLTKQDGIDLKQDKSGRICWKNSSLAMHAGQYEPSPYDGEYGNLAIVIR